MRYDVFMELLLSLVSDLEEYNIIRPHIQSFANSFMFQGEEVIPAGGNLMDAFKKALGVTFYLPSVNQQIFKALNNGKFNLTGEILDEEREKVGNM